MTQKTCTQIWYMRHVIWSWWSRGRSPKLGIWDHFQLDHPCFQTPRKSRSWKANIIDFCCSLIIINLKKRKGHWSWKLWSRSQYFRVLDILLHCISILFYRWIPIKILDSIECVRYFLFVYGIFLFCHLLAVPLWDCLNRRPNLAADYVNK